MLSCLTRSRTTSTSARQLGWFGVDIGSREVRCARIARERGVWRLVAAHVIPFDGGQPLDHAALADGLLGRSLAKPEHWRPRRAAPAACTVSMSLTDLRALELPSGTDDELRQMIGNELADSHGDEPFEFGFWRLPAAADAATANVTALSLRTSTALAAANDLWSQKLCCRTLTAMPYALAQAVALADPESEQQPVAALDWGLSTPSLTIVRRGRPLFTRTLRDCGVGRIVESLAQQLQLPQDDCWQLLTALRRTAPCAAEAYDAPTLAGRIAELATAATRPLLQQLDRTRAFLQQQYRELLPRRVWLFGAGTLLQPVFPLLHSACGVEVRPWRLPAAPADADAGDEPMHALLGAAIGLSALGIAQ